MPFKFLQTLGADDIFISYTRLDASTYAAGLADELTKLGFSCFIDKLGTPPARDAQVQDTELLDARRRRHPARGRAQDHRGGDKRLPLDGPHLKRPRQLQ